ncbi:hypothetical protein VCRA2110O318_160023 [Vibrio crassostreae]|nr:hypothetical protein VCRA2117O328_160106 [Vibrio crassostreae]CAK2278590.1 hypothetical protein VCRA2110O318_160023 [Vibrio crassostreae]CAK2417489.1 hypothetical protein VCRA2110O319_160023 [Vibrio crassostreae]CAK2676662.1 hypothetical protein VCRA217O317_170106 [Vibrio crassostreae]
MSMSKGIKQFSKNVGQSSTELMSTYIEDGFTLEQAKRATDIAMAHKIDHYVDEHFNDKSAAEITSSLSGFGKED